MAAGDEATTALSGRRLTPDLIVASAMELLMAEGHDALSMRRVADALGVKAPALYRHFASKGAMTEAVQLRAMDRFEFVHSPADPWDHLVRELMVALREHLLAYPWVVDIAQGEHAMGLRRLRVDVRPLFESAGLDAATADVHYRLMLWTVWGFVTTELGAMRRGTHTPQLQPDARGPLPRGQRRYVVRRSEEPQAGDPAAPTYVDFDVLFDTTVEHFVCGTHAYADGRITQPVATSATRRRPRRKERTHARSD